MSRVDTGRFSRLRRRLKGQEPMLYPNEYVWFVFVSSMDIMLTWLVLSRGGVEVNPIADYVIKTWGLTGAIVFKYGLMLFVITVCEIVGRKKDFRRGLALARLAVAVSAVPMCWSFMLLYAAQFAPHAVDTGNAPEIGQPLVEILADP